MTIRTSYKNKDQLIQDTDADTGWETEQAADEDKLRGKTGGVECALFDASGVLTLVKQSFAEVDNAEDQQIPTASYTRAKIETEVADTQNEFDSMVKSGTATATTADHLIDTTLSQFAAGDVDYYVWNTADNTYAKVTVFNSTSDLTLDADIMANGETYKLYHIRHTVKTAGRYQVTFGAGFDSNATGIRSIAILKNGARTSYFQVSASSAANWIVTYPAIFNCSVNDYFEWDVYQNSGGNLVLKTTGTKVTILKVA